MIKSIADIDLRFNWVTDPAYPLEAWSGKELAVSKFPNEEGGLVVHRTSLYYADARTLIELCAMAEALRMKTS